MDKVMRRVLLTGVVLLVVILIFKFLNIDYILKNLILFCIWLLGTILYFVVFKGKD